MKAALLGLLVIAAACFSERGAGPIAGAADCRVPVTVIDSLHFLVAIRDFAFHPDTLHVPVGATVTWVNCEDAGTEPHTTTSDTTGIWSSTDLAPGDRFTHTFPSQGTFPYHCIPHADFMRGEIVVS
ncbi:MAG TPA: plastocyanin/azurin family copper-binding protein [Gemmatimonadales bacterium]|jgi:plastocyanin